MSQSAFHTAPAAVDMKLTASRGDGSAEPVTITELSFDTCRISASVTFNVGERLRLHLPGQGWVDVEVQWTCEGEAGAVFVVECKV